MFQFRLGEDKPYRGIGKDVGNSIGGKLDIDRNRDDTRAHGPKQREYKLHMIGREDTDAITGLESRSNKAAGVCVARRVQVAEACCARWPVVRELGDRDSVGFRVLGEHQAKIAGIAARFWITNGHS